MLSVLIIENHLLVRQGLKQLIGHEYDNSAFREAGSVAEGRILLSKRNWI
jgi:hypothetical protein